MDVSTDQAAEGVEPGPPADGEAPEGGADAGRRGVTPNQVVALAFAVVGLRIGLGSLHDNSFFTHLATGRLILDTGSVPTHDPYSFTAHGDAWTVQSWLASVIYAGIDRTVGLLGIRLLVAACTTGLALLVWRLTRPAEGLVGRLAIAVPVLAIGATRWVERPLLFGLLFLGAVLIALEDELDPRWLVPIMWVWVNTHGTFVLGLVAIGAYGLGRMLDRERPVVELRAGLWAALGTALGVLNPLGIRLLVFPFSMLGRREAFAQVVEWQSPTWTDWAERFFAVQLVLAVVLILWRGRRWHNIVPVVVFGGLALQSSRNIIQASIVMIPAMAVAARGLGSIDGRQPRPILRPALVAVAALGVLVAAVGVTLPNTELVDYPVASAAWMRDHDLLDLQSHVVTRDFVGNYLEAAYGPDQVRTYIDDRVDMYPLSVVRDYTTLIDPHGDYQGVLDRAGATAVLWDTDSPFAEWLGDPAHGWTIVHTDEAKKWIVAVPAGTAP